MTDVECLQKKIQLYGFTDKEIASALELERTTLYKKMRGMSEFKQGEIKRLRRILRLSPQEVVTIFLK